MKYSLRSLMIVVTLACVLLGGVMARTEYLRRWAAFHERECRRLAQTEHRSARDAMPDATASLQHMVWAWRFRSAVYRPWTAVDTSLPEIPVVDRHVLAEQIARRDVSDFLGEREPSP